MKNIRTSGFMCSLAFVFLLCTCRKEIDPAYEAIMGKWRCIFIVKSYIDAAGNSFYDTIHPDADYRLEFKKNKKLIMSKSEKCIMDRRVLDCDYIPPNYTRIDFFIKGDREYSLELRTDDTIFIDPAFFPSNYYDQHEENVFYTTYYVRE